MSPYHAHFVLVAVINVPLNVSLTVPLNIELHIFVTSRR